MADTLLRVGLWLLIVTLALFILAESNYGKPWTEMVPTPMLQQALVLSAALIVAGILAHVFGKGAKVVAKNRCKVCRTPVPPGAIYCRAHLRTILHEEDEKLHMTRPGR
jgi:hypothetical protein